MGIVQQIDESNYRENRGGKIARVFPIDKYDLPSELFEVSKDYHALKVPLLGQYVLCDKPGAKTRCGRTSASMTYNWFQLLEGGDPREKYITHWNIGNQANVMELRLPSGDLSFHTNPKAPPGSPTPNGDAPRGVQGLFGYKEDNILPYARTQERMERAKAISQSRERIAEHLEKILDSIRKNSPVVMYSGFSTSADPIHIILLAGYFYLPDSSGQEHLWLMIADPATHENKLTIGMFHPPSEGARKDLASLGALAPEHDMIRLRAGDWNAGQAALILVRARRLFEENKLNGKQFDLFMDYWSDSDANKGGLFNYGVTEVDAPPEVVVSSRMRPRVYYPLSPPGKRGRPVENLFRNEKQAVKASVGGYFPLGSFMNIHSGVHLPVSGSGLVPVRVMAPGHIVAARVVQGLPSEVAAAEDAAAAERNAHVRKLAGNDGSFVLVRHEIEEIVEEGSEAKQFVFYSLYMHLATPDWSDPDGAYGKVGWIDSLVRRRYGSLVVLDPARADCLRRVAVSEAAEEGLVRGGPIGVFGQTFARKETLDLGEPAGGRIKAVRIPAEADITEALTALASGKLVTFADPFLIVDGGEAVGFAGAASGLGSGFVHWEVLGPASGKGQIGELLDFAAEKLGLGKDFFPRFKEENENNLFDADKDELGKLLEHLPDEDGKPAPKADVLGPAYRPEHLLSAMNDPAHPIFARNLPETPPPGAFVHGGKIGIEPYKDAKGTSALPAGSYRMKLRFEPSGQERVVSWDGKASSLKITVPADATKVTITPEGFHAQLDGRAATLEEDVAHFKDLAGARLRRVVVEHVNEWSQKGIEAVIKARFPDMPADEVEKAALAMAFWGAEEEPIVGDDGKETPLFGGGEKQLPKETKLHNVHPVIVAWLLTLLVKHRKARVRNDFERKTADDGKKAAYLGWLPAHEEPSSRVLGAPVQAVVLGKADVDGDEEITLEAVPEGGGEPVILTRGRLKKGMLAHKMALPFWGKWTLKTSDDGAKPIGSLVLDVLRPVPAAVPPGDELGKSLVVENASPPLQVKTKWSWPVDFRKNVPLVLPGWLLFRTWKGKRGEQPPAGADPFQYTSVAIRVDACPEPQNDVLATKGFTVEAGFIVKGPADRTVHVSDNFTWDEYCKAAGGSPPAKLSVLLVEGVQATRRGLTGSAWLAKLQAEGSTIDIAAGDNKAVKTAADKAMAAGWFQSVTQAAPGGPVTVTARAPVVEKAEGGRLIVEFDATSALSALLEAESPGPGEELFVAPSLLFPNGGPQMDGETAKIEPIGTAFTGELDVTAAKASAGGDFIEIASRGVLAVLSRPAIGTLDWKISGASLVVTAPLHGGSPEFWKQAAPQFEVLGKNYGSWSKVKLQGGGEALVLSCSLPFEEGKFAGKELKIKAKATKQGIAFNGIKTNVADTEVLTYDTTAKLKKLTVAEVPAGAPDALSIEVETQGFSTTWTLAVRLEAEGEAGKALEQVRASYKLPYSTGASGKCDEKGVFRATVSLGDLRKALKPESAAVRYRVEVGRYWEPKRVEPIGEDRELAPPPPPEPPPQKNDGPFRGGTPDEQ